MTDEKIDPSKEETDAIGRLAFTDDGRLLHRYLRRVLETVVDMTEASTLLSQNGRRSLARDLMRHMAEGIEAGSGRRDGTGGRNDPILTRSGHAANVSPNRGIRRRVQPNPDHPGPDDTGDAGGNSSGAS